METINSEAGTRVVNDGWFQSFCLGANCVEGGPTAEMSDEDKNRFVEAYHYLEQFAIDKKPPR